MNDPSKEMKINLKKKKKEEETSTDPIWKNTVNWHLTSTPLHFKVVLFLWKRKIYKDTLIWKMIYDMHAENEE